MTRTSQPDLGTSVLCEILAHYILHCIIGSAEALPILCVSDFCERESSRERERERERDPCDVIDITLKSRVIMHMITSTARRTEDPTRRGVLTLSLSSARNSKCMHVTTRSLALGSSRVEWLMNDDGEVEALRSLVRLPWITQQHFVGMLQTRRIDQVDVYFLFEWPWFYLWEQLG